MAFLRMLHEEGYAGDALAVYMAPTKVSQDAAMLMTGSVY
jgi:hypothetical protein